MRISHAHFLKTQEIGHWLKCDVVSIILCIVCESLKTVGSNKVKCLGNFGTNHIVSWRFLNLLRMKIYGRLRWQIKNAAKYSILWQFWKILSIWSVKCMKNRNFRSFFSVKKTVNKALWIDEKGLWIIPNWRRIFMNGSH